MTQNKDNFVHTHVHTRYSMLDGLSKLDELMQKVAEEGQPAVAITDHGNMFGAYDAYKTSKKFGVKAIIGSEFYLAPGDTSRRTRERIRWGSGGGDDVSGGGAFTHATLLAENNQGMHNLFKLSSESFVSGLYYKPRIDRELLSQHSKGIIATTGCPSGEVQTRLRLGQFDEALEAAATYRDIFGQDNYFVEIMDHGLSIEQITRDGLLVIAKRLNLPLLATNDLHYVSRTDAPAHEAMLCVQSGAKLADPNRFKFDAEEFYLKTADEMRSLFPDRPDACDNTLLVAERCNVSFNEGADLMPRFPVPEGETLNSWLEKEIRIGLERRYPNGISQDRIELARYETEVICSMGFAGYFLVVADYIVWAKKNKIRVGPGRGCLDGNTMIWTPQGRKPIKDITTSDKVYDQKGKLVKPTAVHKYPCEEQLITIKSYYAGAGVTLTNDHQVLVKKYQPELDMRLKKHGHTIGYEYGKPEWIRADNVEINDLVCVPKLKNLSAKPLPRVKNLTWEAGANQNVKKSTLTVKQPEATYETGVLLGLWIGDGWLRSDPQQNTVIGFCCQRSQDDGTIKKLVDKVFGDGIRYSYNDHPKKDLRQFAIRHKGLREWFSELFSDYQYTSATKYIPDILLRQNREFLTGLRDGLWMSDGSHSGKSKYATVSRKLADQVAILLNMLGLPASIISAERLDKRNGNQWIEYSVTTSHFFGSIKAQMGRDYDGEYLYYRVRELSKKESDGYVYDITIPTTSSYVADGFIVHNSAAGSLVAYALGITEIDPIVHGLIFERFLNPERVSMPDIDVDFDDTRRGEVIQYVTEKYGADKVAQIVTFGMVKAKAAVKDAARILGEPYIVGEKITKLVPAPIVGKDMSLHGIFDPDHERYKEGADMRALYQKDATVKKVIDTAMGLEGATRQWGVHAAGVILSAEPLTDHIPVLKRESDGAIITQFDQKTCETLGLLKMDFLGLRNLTVIEETLDLIEKNTGVRIIPEDIPYDDHKTFHLVAQGETLGVFQLDSGPMRALLRSMQPDHFEDISAVLALYRPGPMGANAHNDYADRKNKRKPSKPIHPELAEALEEILGPTYGLIVYQEQVQKIAQKLAGYTLGEADLFRRAMGKKDAKELQGQFGKFSGGMKDNGYSEASIKTLWDILLPFSDYAFNKAHTAAYGTISYWTAYFKANYPTEYMAALLSSVQSDKDKTAIYVNECRRMGLSILPPDVNESGAHYTPVSHGIRIGLGAIRNVGINVINAIIDTREEQGAFVSFTDFLDKVPASACNKRTVDSLIKAGAFSLLHDNRAALSFAHAEAIDVYVASKKSKMKGQEDIFTSFAEETGGDHSALYNLPTIPEWDRLTLLGHEREMLGQYVTDHPLRGYQKSVSEKADGSVAFLFPPGGLPRQRRLTKIAGIITTIQSKKTKKGDAYAIFSLEDTTGAVEVTILPGKFAEFQDLIHSDSLVTLTANPDFREDGSYVLLLQSIAHADFIRDPEGWVAGDDGNTVKIINITIAEEKVTPRFVKVMKEIFEDSPGKIEVYMTVISSSSGLLKYKLPFSVKPEVVLPQLKGLLGDDKVTLI